MHPSLACLLLTPSVPRMQKVQDPIRQKLHLTPRQIIPIQSPQLTLTLIVLSQITLFQCNPCVDLIHFHSKVILDSLDRQVLSHRFELVADVRVVVLCAPFAFQQFERLLQNSERPNGFWVRGRCQAKVGLF